MIWLYYPLKTLFKSPQVQLQREIQIVQLLLDKHSTGEKVRELATGKVQSLVRLSFSAWLYLAESAAAILEAEPPPTHSLFVQS